MARLLPGTENDREISGRRKLVFPFIVTLPTHTALSVDDRPITMSCWVATTPGAGGWQLAHALAATGCMASPDDYFNPMQVNKRARALWLGGPASGFGARYLAGMRAAATNEDGVFSARLFWPQTRWLARMAREGLDTLGDVTTGNDADVIARWFPHARYLHLVAGDRARQALRWYATINRGATSPNFQQVRWLETLIGRHDRSWITYFRVHGIAVETVRYEDLQARPHEALSALVASLGLSGLAVTGDEVPVASRLDRRADEWFAEYRALRPQLGSRFAVPKAVS
jgi:LPS sulfotransferase NodH